VRPLASRTQTIWPVVRPRVGSFEPLFLGTVKTSLSRRSFGEELSVPCRAGYLCRDGEQTRCGSFVCGGSVWSVRPVGGANVVVVSGVVCCRAL